MLATMSREEAIMCAVTDLVQTRRHHFGESLFVAYFIHESHRRNHDSTLSKNGEAEDFTYDTSAYANEIMGDMKYHRCPRVAKDSLSAILNQHREDSPTEVSLQDEEFLWSY